MRDNLRRKPTRQQGWRANLNAMFLAVGRDGAPARLFWGVALLVTLCLQFAESVIPSASSNEDLGSMVDTQVTQLQGNGVRQLAYFLIFAVGVICFLRVKDYKLAWRNPIAGLYGALMGWALLSVSWSDDPVLTAKRLVGYLFMVVGAAGVALLYSRKQMTLFMTWFGAVGLTFGIALEVVQHRFTPWMLDYRFSGAQHENVQGFCCVVFMMASLAAADADPRRKLLYRSMAVYGAAFVVLTKCRSCFLSLAVALLVYAVLTQPLVTKLWVSAVLTILGVGFYMAPFSEKVVGFLSRNGDGMDNFTGRVPVWQLADRYIAARPLEGYGFESFWNEGRVQDFSASFGWQVSSAHSGYREILLTLGWVGLTLHVGVLAIGAIVAAIYYKRTRIPLYALTSCIFAALLAYGSLESAILIFGGPYHFSLTLMLASLCFEPLFHGASGEFSLSARRRFIPGRRGASKRLIEA